MYDWTIQKNSTSTHLFQTSGRAYVVQTPERRYVVVSSEEQIRELARAPDEQLSLLATAEEVKSTHSSP